MIGGKYSYNEIELGFVIESTIEDYFNGLIVGYKSQEYHYFKKLSTTSSGNIKVDRSVKNYILIKKTRHYES